MNPFLSHPPRRGLLLAAVLGAALTACGGGDGPAIEGRSQTLQFAAVPGAVPVGGSAQVSATASSGLPVDYASVTPTICAVDAASGGVRALAAGECTISADQRGDATYAAAPQLQLSFAITAAAPGPRPGVTRYRVVQTHYEPDTQPRDSVFTGSFAIDKLTGAVTELEGMLTESMTGSPNLPVPGYGMTLLPLKHQLSVVEAPELGGVLVTTFMFNHTNTLLAAGGGDGWAPGSGQGVHYGFPGTNPGNAYVRVFINPADPTAPLTQAQIDKLAYADCAPGGMMGAVCMTGTTVAGYGSIGTMSGYPVSQLITALE